MRLLPAYCFHFTGDINKNAVNVQETGALPRLPLALHWELPCPGLHPLSGGGQWPVTSSCGHTKAWPLYPSFRQLLRAITAWSGSVVQH